MAFRPKFLCGSTIRFQREIKFFVGNQRRAFHDQLARHGVQIGDLSNVGGCRVQLRDFGQRQHLIGHARRAIHRFSQLRECHLRQHVTALRILYLHFEHGQRRAQLMRCVAHKMLLMVEHAFEPRHHLIERLNQWRKLTRRRCCDGRERLRITLQKLSAQRRNRAHAARDEPPD